MNESVSVQLQAFLTTLHTLTRAAPAARAQIAEVQTVPEAFAIYEQVRTLSRVWMDVTDAAADRCDELLSRM